MLYLLWSLVVKKRGKNIQDSAGVGIPNWHAGESGTEYGFYFFESIFLFLFPLEWFIFKWEENDSILFSFHINNLNFLCLIVQWALKYKIWFSVFENIIYIYLRNKIDFLFAYFFPNPSLPDILLTFFNKIWSTLKQNGNTCYFLLLPFPS